LLNPNSNSSKKQGKLTAVASKNKKEQSRKEAKIGYQNEAKKIKREYFSSH
jgi:hypothetical protein